MGWMMAKCPECGRLLSVQPPAGGDGSADVFPRHQPSADEDAIQRLMGQGLTRISATRMYRKGQRQCRASRWIVEREHYYEKQV